MRDIDAIDKSHSSSYLKPIDSLRKINRNHPQTVRRLARNHGDVDMKEEKNRQQLELLTLASSKPASTSSRLVHGQNPILLPLDEYNKSDLNQEPKFEEVSLENPLNKLLLQLPHSDSLESSKSNLNYVEKILDSNSKCFGQLDKLSELRADLFYE